MNKFFIGSFLVLLISCTNTKHEPFTFVQICDTQLGIGGYNHDVNTFSIAVKQINDLQPNLVFICGDLVNNPNDSTYSDFKDIVSGFDMPCYYAPGNHDVGIVPTDSTLSYYRKTIGKDYFSINHKGCSFIVTNSQLWRSDLENESVKHDNWFNETINNIENDNMVFVIGHYPLFFNSIDEKDNINAIPLLKRKELIETFKNNNVVAYLGGHVHSNVTHQYNSIDFVYNGTTSKTFDGSPLGFSVWNISSNNVKNTFVNLKIKK